MADGTREVAAEQRKYDKHPTRKSKSKSHCILPFLKLKILLSTPRLATLQRTRQFIDMTATLALNTGISLTLVDLA